MSEPAGTAAAASWSLRTRLVLAVSLIVALVLGLESVLEIRLFEEATDQELRDTGLVTPSRKSSDRPDWICSSCSSANCCSREFE